MRYLYHLLLLLLFSVLQTTFLADIIPWFPLNPAFVALVIMSFRLERTPFLIAALWTGLVQDVLVGQTLGMFMLTHFIASAIIWEVKDTLMEELVLTCGLRLIIATIVKDLVLAFIFYTQNIEPGNLLFVLQVNVGINLLTNLSLYTLYTLFLKIRGQKIASILEVQE